MGSISFHVWPNRVGPQTCSGLKRTLAATDLSNHSTEPPSQHSYCECSDLFWSWPLTGEGGATERLWYVNSLSPCTCMHPVWWQICTVGKRSGHKRTSVLKPETGWIASERHSETDRDENTLPQWKNYSFNSFNPLNINLWIDAVCV